MPAVESGKSTYDVGRNADAERELRAAIERARIAATLYSLGLLLAEEKRLNEAVEDSQSCKNEPVVPVSYNYRSPSARWRRKKRRQSGRAYQLMRKTPDIVKPGLSTRRQEMDQDTALCSGVVRLNHGAPEPCKC